jgi:phosphoesterase RecJ-like protein
MDRPTDAPHENAGERPWRPPSTAALDDALERLAAIIEGHRRFVVASHLEPDGDAVGSTLAMGALLESLGKEVVRYNPDPIPYNYRFLPGSERWRHEIPEDFDPEVLVALDFGVPGLAGDDLIAAADDALVVVLDHHSTLDEDFADHAVRDVDAAATGELVYRAALRTGAELTRPLAMSLYCCLMTDTGGFRYASTSRNAMWIAGTLLECGVDPWEMSSHIYESEPLERIELLGQVLSTLETAADGRLACLRIERDMYDGAIDEALVDGFINRARSIRGVEMAVQLLELGQGRWEVTFRSRGSIDASELAAPFGGSGGRHAARFVSDRPHDELVAALADELERIASC